MEKKALLTAAFISALLFSAIVGARFVDLGKAKPNPIYTLKDPPVISVHLPMNKTYSSTKQLYSR